MFPTTIVNSTYPLPSNTTLDFPLSLQTRLLIATQPPFNHDSWFRNKARWKQHFFLTAVLEHTFSVSAVLKGLQSNASCGPPPQVVIGMVLKCNYPIYLWFKFYVLFVLFLCCINFMLILIKKAYYDLDYSLFT